MTNGRDSSVSVKNFMVIVLATLSIVGMVLTAIVWTRTDLFAEIKDQKQAAESKYETKESATLRFNTLKQQLDAQKTVLDRIDSKLSAWIEH